MYNTSAAGQSMWFCACHACMLSSCWGVHISYLPMWELLRCSCHLYLHGDSHVGRGQYLACRISTNKQSLMAMWTPQQLQQRTWSSTNSVLLYLLKVLTAQSPCIASPLFVLSSPVQPYPHLHTCSHMSNIELTFCNSFIYIILSWSLLSHIPRWWCLNKH